MYKYKPEAPKYQNNISKSTDIQSFIFLRPKTCGKQEVRIFLLEKSGGANIVKNYYDVKK
jgi:hypothetical protein